jgi:YtkA-like protein
MRLRTLRTIPLLVVIIACVAALGALTDKPKVEVQTPPVVQATKPWDTIVEVTRRGRPLDGYKAVLTLTGPKGTTTTKVHAKELGSGRYRVRVRLPRGGFYTYTLSVGDRIAARGTVYSIPR